MSNKVSRAFSKVINLVVAATAQGASKGELGSPDTTEEMKSIARTAAEEGIVMLKIVAAQRLAESLTQIRRAIKLGCGVGNRRRI